MTGSLEGCWYTKILTAQDNGTPSGVYLEAGEEVFVGSLDDGSQGTFETTYKFQSKWDPEVTGGSEVHGRCEHPNVAGSGTGGFEAATGRVDFKMTWSICCTSTGVTSNSQGELRNLEQVAAPLQPHDAPLSAELTR